MGKKCVVSFIIILIIGLLFAGLVTKVIDQKDTCKIKECEMNDKKIYNDEQIKELLEKKYIPNSYPKLYSHLDYIYDYFNIKNASYIKKIDGTSNYIVSYKSDNYELLVIVGECEEIIKQYVIVGNEIFNSRDMKNIKTGIDLADYKKIYKNTYIYFYDIQDENGKKSKRAISEVLFEEGVLEVDFLYDKGSYLVEKYEFVDDIDIKSLIKCIKGE